MTGFVEKRVLRSAQDDNISVASALGWWRGGGDVGHGDHAGELEEGHAGFEEDRVDHSGFGVVEVAFGLFFEDAEEVDGLLCAEDVDAGALALLGAGSHLDHG